MIFVRAPNAMNVSIAAIVESFGLSVLLASLSKNVLLVFYSSTNDLSTRLLLSQTVDSLEDSKWLLLQIQ